MRELRGNAERIERRAEELARIRYGILELEQKVARVVRDGYPRRGGWVTLCGT